MIVWPMVTPVRAVRPLEHAEAGPPPGITRSIVAADTNGAAVKIADRRFAERLRQLACDAIGFPGNLALIVILTDPLYSSRRANVGKFC
jgi:hypothetical protein